MAKKEQITIKPELSLEPLFERVAVGGECLTLLVVHFSIWADRFSQRACVLCALCAFGIFVTFAPSLLV
jgi:hypothetical protein